MRRLVPIALILIAALLLIGGGTAVFRSAFQDKSEHADLGSIIRALRSPRL